MKPHPVLTGMYHGLIVSCQAGPDEPLHGANHMAAMARAAAEGGAVAIRADTPADIRAIRGAVALPIIGIYKVDLPGFEVRITPTLDHARQIAEARADAIALDATHRAHPGGLTAADLIAEVRCQTGLPVIADISTLEEGLTAAQAGADAVATTLSGYTGSAPVQNAPDFELVQRLASLGTVPVIAEGRIATPAQALQALKLGAYAVVVGSAITRPQLITRSFVDALREHG